MRQKNLSHTKYRLLYQDDDIIAVKKPSGLLCVPGLSDPNNLFDQVRVEYPHARIVHRLDMSTSGIVLFALNYNTQRAISQMFEARQVYKEYIAVVSGKVLDSAGEIHSPLICDWPNRPKQKIDWLAGKLSSTYFKRVSCDNAKSRVKLFPYTGRTHQLRLHMLQIGHPILGDALYNINDSEKASTRLLLHAESISFVHPSSSTMLYLTSPADF